MKGRIIVITGEQGSGKTTQLLNLVSGLKKLGLKPGGFIAEGFWEQNKRSHFDLVDVKTGNRILFCSKNMQPDWDKAGPFFINPAAVAFGEKLLNPSIVVQDDFIAIDEIGPFELAGKGWTKAITNLLKALPAKQMIWVVRYSLLHNVGEYFGILPGIIIHTGIQQEDWIEKVASQIQEHQ